MLAIADCGSADHFIETGVAANSTAPAKVAPINITFCIVAFSSTWHCLCKYSLHFADAVCSELNGEQATTLVNWAYDTRARMLRQLWWPSASSLDRPVPVARRVRPASGDLPPS